MFPSANYFRDIQCPFFSRVSCPRPHCHFKHVQASSINIPPDANETLNKLINQLSSASATTTTTAAPSIDFSSIFQSTLLQSLTTVFANALNASAPPTVTPTPNNTEITEKLTQAISTIAVQLQQHQTTAPATTDAVPEYRPTPIAELQRRKHQQTSRPAQKIEVSDFDADGNIQATFSPPSISSPPSPTHPSEPSVEETKPKASTADQHHSWVAPPTRQKLPSSTDSKDFEPRKSGQVGKSIPSTTGASLNKASTSRTTDPMLKRIPKKSTPTKVRIADIDLDRVPVTSSIALDVDPNQDTKVSSTSLKRSSNDTNGVPQKRPKPSPAASNAKKNGQTSSSMIDEDDELALFDLAFASSKIATAPAPVKKLIPRGPPSSLQQLTARYPVTSPDPTAVNRTRAETASDGRRIAHQPKVHTKVNQPAAKPSMQPLVDAHSSANKIPFKTRQEYLTFFLNELKKHTNNTSHDSTLARAQTIEKEIFDKSTNRNSYVNIAAKHLRQIRSEDTKTKEQTVPKKTDTPRLVVSHSAMLTGGKTENISFAVKKAKQVDIKSLTDNELYIILLAYKASLQDLTENGYPAFSLDFPDKVIIKQRNPLYNSTTKAPSSDPMVRTCCRCSKNYRVDEDGEHVTQEDCIYHWGRIRSQRIARQLEKVYSCCGSRLTGVGCAISKYHVHDGDDTKLLSGFVKTQPVRKPLPANETYGIYALDCEMCYTLNGVELVRVSVVNHKLESVYETFVKPHQTVLDYNTRWSGITAADLDNCNVRITDVQRDLLKLFNSQTILIGHSLENDLKSLKIVHETVVDTSLVFPHAKGKPYKRALKTLSTEYLTKIIQESANGHNSIEDAITCMELMLRKVKEDLKHTSTDR